MAFININSQTAVNASCDLFSMPPTQRTVEQGLYQEYRPLTSLDADDAPLEFNIPPTGDDYLDLAHSRLRIRCKIVTQKGEELKPENHVGPVNNFLHSIFSNCQVELNQKPVTGQSGLYHYRAIVENILNYGNDAKESHLGNSLFYKDTAGNMDAEDENEGFVTRREYTQSGEFEMESHIHSDLFSQNKYMLNNVQMTIKFYKNKPEVSLMTTTSDNASYKIKITEAVLMIRKVKITPSVLIAHAQTLSKHTAKYPITHVELKNVNIPANIQSTTLDNLILGIMPQRVIVMFVDAASFNGSFKSNPFNFQHFNYNYLNISSDSTMHNTPLKPNFKSKMYVSAYNTMFTATGITRKEYAEGYSFAIFDLTPDISSHDNHLTPATSGSLRIEVQFESALAKPIVAIVYAEFPALIEINKHREVFCDYST